MNLRKLILTENACYKAGKTIVLKRHHGIPSEPTTPILNDMLGRMMDF